MAELSTNTIIPPRVIRIANKGIIQYFLDDAANFNICLINDNMCDPLKRT